MNGPRAALVLLGLLCWGATSTPGDADSMLTCVFASGTATFYEDAIRGGPIEASVDRKEQPWTVVFAGLDGDRPRFKGTLGEENLIVLKRTADAVWLGESPVPGGINVWTVFVKAKTAILSKQYGLMGGNPLGILSMGKCR